ncbi:uncharacterized protein LOC110234824 [Exaiptasia diaphana]|uniref:NTR domain-containing protein n=1 Tax=Exaiptasia diaphana TaxID=2652724 RepID=A0A913WY47_EXADI|nr:uncharacterized protein LOC110234824 [Exaiptasia diaphana]
MNLTLYLCLAAVCFVTVSKACSCVTRDTSTPEFLCCNDYVLRGTVVKSVVTGNKSRPESQERVFTVKVQEIFKGKEKIKDIAGDTSQVNISTAVQSATCGTNIPSNKDYLISGHFWNNKIRNSLCNSWNVEWSSVKQSFKDFTPKLKTCPCGVGCLLPLQALVALAIITCIINYF